MLVREQRSGANGALVTQNREPEHGNCVGTELRTCGAERDAGDVGGQETHLAAALLEGAVGDEGVQVHEQPEVAAESLDHHEHDIADAVPVRRGPASLNQAQKPSGGRSSADARDSLVTVPGSKLESARGLESTRAEIRKRACVGL